MLPNNTTVPSVSSDVVHAARMCAHAAPVCEMTISHFNKATKVLLLARSCHLASLLIPAYLCISANCVCVTNSILSCASKASNNVIYPTLFKRLRFFKKPVYNCTNF
jgi:hypothetical protein